MTAIDTTTERRLNLDDYEAVARTVLPSMFVDFIGGGSCDEVTLRDNRAAFDRWRFLPRVLSGVSEIATATTVLGQEISLPVLVAPTGLHRLAHDDGELASARAARDAGAIYTMSTAATVSIEAVAAEAGPWWFQLYVFSDREITREIVARAVAAGASALVVTVDVPALGRREADERHRFTLPPGLALANLRTPEHQQLPSSDGSSLNRYTGAHWEPALTWADLDWLASLSPLPIIPKGILHPADAVLAVEHGARAVIVSNHGGRQLDSAVASLDALPAVVEAVADRAEVLVDGGIRRGGDVLKALALGARAVLVGRPILWGLAAAGEAGARHVIEMLRDELALDLKLCGLASPAQVTRQVVVPANAVVECESGVNLARLRRPHGQ